ncbi:hypothetical protein PF005_g4616 [Phytophthora fragariae]|uniref:Core-binding (CB) domain-containing protein n=1 Tax=Phytophthora fragariae TaxID=53985 RepID=A0A6A3UK11_9STRA|nr:hypothetical protein PF003_g24802 [Phytophthora fragariae]KAE8945419.1 hypothetical protein PF009_g4926 [Phytophthora fragariae]KAE9027131.1 hypothetical protein PF011_g2190 [Phytophthora fragariae]KAE9130090.1 hypothetical protein PF010_g3949 [Phytophthora fragariae]KAE9132341.1 hypothetical protein PF007_g3752 [Phytophthora fragariae]
MASSSTQPSSNSSDETNVVTPTPPSLTDQSLSAESVRRACTSSRTQTAYRSYRRGVAAWIRQTKEEPEQYFEPGGGIDINVFTPKDFEEFLLSKMCASGKTLKVTTLGGYRSAIKDIYREKKLALPAAYADEMKTFFAGLKRIEAERNQTGSGESKMAGKMALPYSVYEAACKKMIVLGDNGFAHLYLTFQWNLMCRSQSVETINSGHISYEDDSIGVVFHKSKVNQDGNAPKDPRHIYANPFSPWTCCITALGIYWAYSPRQDAGPIFPGSLQRNRF